LLRKRIPEKGTVVVGRDARISGKMVSNLVTATLAGLGFDVLDLGLSTTPTVEMAVPASGASGGIILTASHNPAQWNALKLLNDKGEFISAIEGEEILELYESGNFPFQDTFNLGAITEDNSWMDYHISKILELNYVLKDKISDKKFKVLVDPVNSSGAIFVPALLNKLGITNIVLINENPNGHFSHNPEPLKENLVDTCKAVLDHKCDLGIVVDPDVDRLVFIDEKGNLFGEEYTLVAVADYMLGVKKGNTVSNLSSTRALRDITLSHGGTYFSAAVGEVNVVTKMKEVHAIIGGEGNGGVILPDLHYGRDALAGIALFLSKLAISGIKMSELKETYPIYEMGKSKINLEKGMDVDGILNRIASRYSDLNPSTIDGVKIDFSDSWVHLRKSNTEPIIRIYTEANTQSMANELGEKFIEEIKNLL
jgi:phosphomannomutase